jgi:NUBPL iron-transfer P-loop NTPase
MTGRSVFVLVVVTPQVIAHQDARRLIADLGRHRAASVGGVENMSGQICPNCAEPTPLFPEAPAGESIWGLIPRLARVPFSAPPGRAKGGAVASGLRSEGARDRATREDAASRRRRRRVENSVRSRA